MALEVDLGKISDLESAIVVIRELLKRIEQQERQIEKLRRNLEEAKRAETTSNAVLQRQAKGRSQKRPDMKQARSK